MEVALTFTALLLVALVVEPLARRVHVPFSAALVLVGFVGSESIVALGFDTGLRWQHFTALILNVLVPVLVFESAYNLRHRDLLAELVPVLYLAIPLLVLATFVTGTLVYWGIGHPTGFPWLVALVAGVLLSTTDPSAVLASLSAGGATRRLRILLEGESLFNDATAIVLFGLLLTLSVMPADAMSIPGAVLEFLRVFCGGLLVGAVVGAIGAALSYAFEQPVPCALVTLAGALVSVYLAERAFDVSGAMAALAAGLSMGQTERASSARTFTATLWELNAYTAYAFIFLLVGVTITVQMFLDRWLAMLIGLAAVLVTRALVVYALLPLVQALLPRSEPLGLAQRTVLYWGGLPGAVTLALALSLPLELDAWWTVQSMAYGVVPFGLLAQALTTRPLLNWLQAGKHRL